MENKQGWHPFDFKDMEYAEKDYEFYDILWINNQEVALLECFRSNPETVFLNLITPQGQMRRHPHIRLDNGEQTLADVKRLAEIETGIRPELKI